MRFRRTPDRLEGSVVPDDLPRDKIFAQPLVVAKLTAATLDAPERTVEFRATIKDAEGKRCPDMAVHATITGPERTASGMAHTDLMGVVRFRMHGPSGAYAIEVTDVAAGGLDLDREASTLTADVTRHVTS